MPEPSDDGMSRPSEAPITFRASYYLRRAISAGAREEGLSVAEFVRRAMTTFFEQREPPYPRTNKAVRSEQRRARFMQHPVTPNGDPVAPAAEQARGDLPAFLQRPVPTYGEPIPTANDPAEENQ
jgi:hypothetical protein